MLYKCQILCQGLCPDHLIYYSRWLYKADNHINTFTDRETPGAQRVSNGSFLHLLVYLGLSSAS